MNNPEQSSKEEWKPEPAESFAIDYLNTKKDEVSRAMSALNFRFLRSGPEGDGETQVYFEGESGNDDGTKIRIEITKGPKYKSPAELAQEEAKSKGESK